MLPLRTSESSCQAISGGLMGWTHSALKLEFGIFANFTEASLRVSMCEDFSARNSCGESHDFSEKSRTRSHDFIEFTMRSALEVPKQIEMNLSHMFGFLIGTHRQNSQTKHSKQEHPRLIEVCLVYEGIARYMPNRKHPAVWSICFYHWWTHLSTAYQVTGFPDASRNALSRSEEAPR